MENRDGANIYPLFDLIGLLFFSDNKLSPRKELLHNINPLTGKIGQRKYNDSFNNRIRAAIRVGDMKLLTGNVGEPQAIDVISSKVTFGKSAALNSINEKIILTNFIFAISVMIELQV